MQNFEIKCNTHFIHCKMVRNNFRISSPKNENLLKIKHFNHFFGGGGGGGDLFIES